MRCQSRNALHFRTTLLSAELLKSQLPPKQHRLAGLSGFVFAAKLVRKVRHKVHSACLRRGSTLKYSGQWGVHPPSLRCMDNDYGFEIGMGHTLRDRGRAQFQGCNSKSNASRVLYPHPLKRKVLQVSCTVPSFLLTTILLFQRALPRRCTMCIYLIFLFEFRSVFSKQICRVYALAVLWFASQTCLEAHETGFLMGPQ